MRILIILLLTFSTSYYAIAQQFEVDTIQMNGNTDKLINIVILGDGYTQNQLSQFANDARDATSAFFNEAPFSHYQNYFNVFAIKVPSNVSGAANDPSQLIDNYFGSTFNYAGIEYLLVPTKTSNIVNVLASNFPAYDQVAMVVNDTRYGGSGGWVATFSTDASSREIFLHELAHSFSDLADEYWAGPQYAAEKINMTQNTNLATLKWKNWYGDFNIGLFQHTESPTWYRPHQNCKMRYLGVSFCAVCSEGLIERIHTLVSPIYSYSPASGSITDNNYPLSFNLELIKPNPNTLRTEWIFNNSVRNLNEEEFILNEADLIQGLNTISVCVEDTTKNLRVDNHNSIHLSVVNWEIQSTTSIKDISLSTTKMDINIYPNPFQDHLSIKFKQNLKENLKVEIIDILGRIQATEVFSPQECYSLNLSNLHIGYYIMNLYLDNTIIASTKIIKE
jgi:hypothetical protein